MIWKTSRAALDLPKCPASWPEQEQWVMQYPVLRVDTGPSTGPQAPLHPLLRWHNMTQAYALSDGLTNMGAIL